MVGGSNPGRVTDKEDHANELVMGLGRRCEFGLGGDKC